MREWRRGRSVRLAGALAAILAAHAVSFSPDGRGEEAASGMRVALEIPGREAVSLHIEEQGAGDPVLLLHGLGESTFTWHEIVPALAARHRVIALDLKGFGRSGKPDDGAYSAEDQADLVARFILDRGLENVTLVGHSFGGTVALRTALADGIRGTGRIKRIAVIGSPGLPGSTARYLDLVKTPVVPDTLASTVPPDALARLLLSEAMARSREPTAEEVEGYAAPYRDPAALKAFFATARSIVTEKDRPAVVKRYRALRLPVLAVWCRKDPIVPLRAGRRLASALPNARLVVLEGCHHLPQHEAPGKLLGALQPFLDE